MVSFLLCILPVVYRTIGSSGPACPLSSTPAASCSRSRMDKMRRQRTTKQASTKRPEGDEMVEMADPPAFQLSASLFNVPTNSFSMSAPTTSNAVTPVVADAKISQKQPHPPFSIFFYK